MQLTHLSLFAVLAATVSAAPTLLAARADPVVAPLSSRFQPAGANKAAWTTVGCVADQHPDRRILNGGYQELQGGMTIGKCLAYCDSQGQHLAGIEFGYQCFCGPQLDFNAYLTVAAANLTAANNGGCSSNAAGNSAQSGGGPNHALVFRSLVNGPAQIANVTNSTYLGCYADSQQKRLLPIGYYGLTGNTAESCIARCKAGGNDLASLEFSSECHCGKSTGSSAVQLPAKSSETKCEMVCTGNKKQLCGGASFQGIYKTSLLPSNSTITPPNNSTTTPPPNNSTVTPPPSSTVTLESALGNFVYVGCFKDSASARSLSAGLGTSTVRTNAGCVRTCANRGYKYASTQNGNECRCDNKVLALTPATTCNKPCTGKPSEFCGGSNYTQSLYQLSTAPKAGATAVDATK